MAPNREPTVRKVGESAGRANRSVHLMWAQILCLQCANRRLCNRRLHVANGDGGARLLLEPRMEARRIGHGLVLVPACHRRQSLHGLDGAEFTVGDHRQKIAIAHDLPHSRHLLYTARLHALEPRTVAWRSHDARVHHALRAKVLDIGRTSRDFGGNVDALHRLTHQRKVLARL